MRKKNETEEKMDETETAELKMCKSFKGEIVN